MGHEGHAHTLEEKTLSFFASPLHEGGHSQPHSHPHGHAHGTYDSSDIENPKVEANNEVPFTNADCTLHDNPSFHRHAEATTAELFYDLFFVANLTTFTSIQEINDRHSLTAYVGFFSLLWLTWYQVSLYDVRFSTDSVFERVAKAIHFGVMVGFAVIGPQWKPGQEIQSYKIYKAFGLILMTSRITLFCQYAVTLFYTKKYKRTVMPLALVMAWTLLAAILYGALTPVFPKHLQAPRKSDVYIAWYIIGITETILTVTVSCIWRVISFKGTHMVQRMSLLTLIILGEGIIVTCKSISKIVKNEFPWTPAIVGQVIASVLIIYFLYMLYFDRIHEDHFGSIKQQIWSFLHFPLHVVLVLVLQGISLLVIWRQALQAFDGLDAGFTYALDYNYTSGADLATALNATAYSWVYDYIPKGVDASKELKKLESGLKSIASAYDYLIVDNENSTAIAQLDSSWNDIYTATSKSLFDSLSISVPKDKKDPYKQKVSSDQLFSEYIKVFELVFVYVFIAGGLALIIISLIGFLGLPSQSRRLSEYLRLAVLLAVGISLCMLTLIKFSPANEDRYLSSAWMIPTICVTYFVCVLVNHIRRGKKKVH